MIRATLLVTLALGLLVAPLAAKAQPPGKVPRLGYLGDTPGPYPEASVEYRWAEGNDDRLPDLAAELVRLPVDVIVTPGTQSSHAAKHATTTIPIVMAHVGDPLTTGLVASLARPGGNITGVSIMGRESEGKRLELLKQAVPQASRVAVLWRATHPLAPHTLSELQVAAPALGVTLQPVAVRGAEDFESAFATITTAHADALFVVQDHLFTSYRARIVDFAAQSRLPAVYM